MAQIQQATSSDVPILLPLVKDYWNFEGIRGFDSKGVAEQLERLLSDSNLGGGWIAFEEGAAVGYLFAVYVFSLEHLGVTAEIDELFVIPQQRGQGVGQALLKTAESVFERAGYTNISLQLSCGNDFARHFYHRQWYIERSGYELLEKMLRGGQ